MMIFIHLVCGWCGGTYLALAFLYIVKSDMTIVMAHVS